MKKISDILAKVFTAVAVVPIVSLSIVACTKNTKKDNGSNIQNAENQSQSGSNQENTGNVSDSEEEEEKTYTLNGFYTFTGDYSRKNFVYDTANKQELLDCFETRDLNGAFYKAESLGLKEFVKNITTFEGNQIAICIRTDANAESDILPDGSVTNSFAYVVKEGEHSFSSFEQDLHKVTITENGYETAENEPIIVFDEKTNALNLIYQFTYTDADGNVVETPLYYKTTLVYEPIFEFENANNSNLYSFSETSSLEVSIPEELLETVTEEDALDEIVTKFEYVGEEKTLDAINAYLLANSQNIMFVTTENNAVGLWTSFDNPNRVNFIPQNEDGTFDVAGLHFTLTYSEDGNQAIFSATLDCGAQITITLNLFQVEQSETPEIPEQNNGVVDNNTDGQDNGSDQTENV